MQIQLGKASFPGVSAGSLQLRSSQCIGRDGGSHIYFTFGLDECGTQHNETDTEIIYSNEVIYRDYWNDTIITRQKKIAAQFVCVYKREGHASTSFSIRKTASLKLGSNGTITFLMDIYRTHAYLSAYRWWEYPIRVGLNDPLFIQYSVQSNKTGIYVFADSCYATNTGSPNTWPRYKFIDKGSRCQQRCDHALIRKRRGLDQSENQEVDLFVPLMGDKSDVRFGGQKGSVHNKPMIAGLGALGGLLILVSAAFVFVTMRKKQDVNDKPAIELDAVASAANQGIEEDAEGKKYIVEESLVKDFLTHLNHLEMMRNGHMKSKRKKQQEDRMSFDDFDWNKMLDDGTLEKQRVAILDKCIDHYQLLSVRNKNKPEKLRAIIKHLTEQRNSEDGSDDEVFNEIGESSDAFSDSSSDSDTD
ncbi:predicted protein [Nematostella vectensis]|uniref:ZP domain-containing protein n=1 Tax=Nematostella vectensis TaxID=45351 RepID=A7T0L7_NEMVE|nr:predicted protein [Nematostella vectensis]|eukprot:XP_001622604.1 hypothetical protein NEMVEDRAFT_v1g220488 [Nematostella vectensis]